MKTRFGTQRGFSILAAIFILVVLTVLGAVIATLAGTQHIGVAQVVESSRATAAARSGVEWGAWQALEEGNCSSSTEFELEEAALSGFRLTVECRSSTHTERGESFTLYEILAIAERGEYGRIDYVKRELRAQFAGDS